MTGLILVPVGLHDNIEQILDIIALFLIVGAVWATLIIMAYRRLDEAIRRIAEDRTAGPRHDPGDAGRQEEKGTQYVVHESPFQNVPLAGPSVERPPDWGTFTSLPEMREDPPEEGED